MVQYLLKQTHECENCQAMFLYEMDWARHVFLDACLPELRKENSMEEQMEQVWRSKDGKVTGSKKEVEAYLKSKNPLAKMGFPYERHGISAILRKEEPWKDILWKETEAVIAFANLAPLIHEWRKMKDEKGRGSWDSRAIALMDAYDEALRQVPQ